MMTMNEDELRREGQARAAKFRTALIAAGVGLAALIAGFGLAQGRSGDVATGLGVLAGMGFALTLGGVVLAVLFRPGDTRWRSETRQGKRERLQAQRSQQLWLFPLVGTVFLFQATRALAEIQAGGGEWFHYLSVFLPVLYAWLVAAIAMGWDGQSRKNRRWLEDELTVSIRARAMTAASLVLMAGLTVALALGLWRPEIGVMALPFALTAGGTTAGLRFAWLDREAGRLEPEHG